MLFALAGASAWHAPRHTLCPQWNHAARKPSSMALLWKLQLTPPRASRAAIPLSSRISIVRWVAWGRFPSSCCSSRRGWTVSKKLFCMHHSAEHQAGEAKGALTRGPLGGEAPCLASWGCASGDLAGTAAWLPLPSGGDPALGFDEVERAAGPAASPSEPWAPKAGFG